MSSVICYSADGISKFLTDNTHRVKKENQQQKARARERIIEGKKIRMIRTETEID